MKLVWFRAALSVTWWEQLSRYEHGYVWFFRLSYSSCFVSFVFIKNAFIFFYRHCLLLISLKCGASVILFVPARCTTLTGIVITTRGFV